MQISTTSWEIFNVQCDCNVGFEVTAVFPQKPIDVFMAFCRIPLCKSNIGCSWGKRSAQQLFLSLFWVDYNTSKSPFGEFPLCASYILSCDDWRDMLLVARMLSPCL